jgi:hypothetical protein
MPDAGLLPLQFDHRSEDAALRSVCELFWMVELDKRGTPTFPHRTHDLAAKLATLGRDIRPPRVPYLVAELCVARVVDVACPSCGGPWIIATRGEYVSAWQSAAVPMPTPCGMCRPCEESRRLRRQAAKEQKLLAVRGAEEARRATESAARAAEEAKIAAKRELHERSARRVREIIRHWFNPRDLEAPELAKLSLERAVFLLAVAENRGDGASLPRILPVEGGSHLSPNGWLDRHIIRSLARDVLAVDPESDVDAFSWDQAPPPRPDWTRVSFVARGEHSEGILWTVTAVKHAFLRRDWNIEWNAQMPRLWARIATDEVLARLALRLREFGFFAFVPEEEHREQLRPLAEEFAVGQLWSLAWVAGKEAGDLWRRRRLLREHVVGTAITILASFADQLRRGERRPHMAFREKALPQSSLSRAFFKTALHLSEQYTRMTAEAYVNAALVPA